MKKKRYTVKKCINDIHLWLGLGSGIVLFLVCFSGTILAFDHEIKAFFAEEFVVIKTENRTSVSALVELVKNDNIGYVSKLEIPVKANAPYVFSVKEDLSKKRSTKVLVDPYSARIQTVEKTTADAFLFSMFKLHRWLLLDSKIGRPIVGVATIIFILLALSGLILWFPKKIKWKTLKSGLKIKTSAKWKRINHDLHNTLGFYSCILILVMGITGLCWSFEGYRVGLGYVMGTTIFDRSAPEFQPSQDENTVSIDAILKLANKTLTYDGVVSVSFPNSKNNYYTIKKTNVNNWSPVIVDKMYLDTSGVILAVDYFNKKPLNVQLASLIKPLHTGKIYGLFSKILYFIACLIATSLPVTGTIIWLNKLKKKKKSVVN